MKIKKVLTAMLSGVIALSAVTFGAENGRIVETYADDSEQFFSTWQSAYRNCLCNYNQSSESMFDIYDINDDGTPELIISPASTSRVLCKIYTFYDNELIDLGMRGNYGEILVDKDQGIICTDFSAYGYRSYQFDIFDGIGFVSTDWFYNDENSYKINDTVVSQNQYNTAFEEYTGNYISVGRSYRFDELEIEKDGVFYCNFFDSYEAYAAYYDITSAVIPDTINGVPVTAIRDSAFNNCEYLKSVQVGNNVEVIGEFAFFGCTSLKSVTIPANTYYIDNIAFVKCGSLTEIIVSEYNPYYKSIDGVLFNYDCSELIRFPEGKSSDNYRIPTSVYSIESYAFAFCDKLTSITLPEGVEAVYAGAYIDCSNLASITVLNPECLFWDNWDDVSGYTISNERNEVDDVYYYNGVIRGYDNSTAQEYAEWFGRKFESLGAAPGSDEPPVYGMTGDVNNDGTINPVDATNILRYYTSKASRNEISFDDLS